MNRLRFAALLFVLVMMVSVAGAAEIVNVTVDGSLVAFTGVPAQMMGGRVMVPLRGVLERLGASVQWDAPSRTILVQKGTRNVVLPVGSTTAKVDGANVTLDTPAVVLLGTTMVPLRFVGEALGADVKWFGSTRTVQITSSTTSPGGVTPPVPDVSAKPVIVAFRHNASGWLLAGEKVTFYLEGTPAGTAAFEIPGATTQPQPIKESTNEPGVYQVVWTVPADAHSVSGASVMGQLTVGGKSATMQAPSTISIDATPPGIADMAPAPSSSSGQTRPNISATYEDPSGSGVDANSVKMTLDGKNVTTDANVTAAFISYKPAAALAAGPKVVGLLVRDKAGNTATKSWRFTVKTASNVIKSFTYTAPANAGPGDVITAKLQGDAGGKATFWFVNPAGAKILERTLVATSAGVYQGEYTIRKGDDLSGASVVGSLTTTAGETFSMVADKTLAGKPVDLSAPTVVVPGAGKSVSSPLVIKGKSNPSGKVRVAVTYEAVLGGVFPVSGKVTEQTLTCNTAGGFSSEAVDLGTMFSAGDTIYTLTAVAIAADGKESPVTTVQFKRL